jgi:hypothetical protein
MARVQIVPKAKMDLPAMPNSTDKISRRKKP